MTQPTLFDNPTPFYADGETYDKSEDQCRLETLMGRVMHLMSDGKWRTLGEIQALCGGSEASVSARLRDARKKRFGGHTVERRRIAGGLWEYRIEESQK